MKARRPAVEGKLLGRFIKVEDAESSMTRHKWWGGLGRMQTEWRLTSGGPSIKEIIASNSWVSLSVMAPTLVATEALGAALEADLEVAVALLEGRILDMLMTFMKIGLQQWIKRGINAVTHWNEPWLTKIVLVFSLPEQYSRSEMMGDEASLGLGVVVKKKKIEVGSKLRFLHTLLTSVNCASTQRIDFLKI